MIKNLSQFKNSYREIYYRIKSYFFSIYAYIINFFLVLLFLPLSIILFPIYLYLFNKKYKFIDGFMSGTGHLIPEFDAFILKNRFKNNIVFIDNEEQEFNFIKNNFKFKKNISNKYFFYFFKFFIYYYPKLKLNVSFTKHHNFVGLNIFSDSYKLKYYFKFYNEYLKIRKKNKSFFKSYYKNIKPSNSINNLIDQNKKLVCVHIKEIVINAVGEKVDPSSYLETLNFLNKNNYQIFFIGREKFPKIFNDFDIFDYANSNFASFENDFILINKSFLNIICGSGISYIPDTLDKRYLYINSWHISRPGGIGNKSLILPSLVKNNFNNNFLSFRDQAILENSGNMFFPQFVNKKKFSIRNISSSELLDATIEIINDDFNNLDTRQLKFKEEIKNYGWIYNSNANISKKFVKKYESLLS